MPLEVCDEGLFERWRIEEEKREPRLLFMEEGGSPAGGCAGDHAGELSGLSRRIREQGLQLSVKYRYEPGECCWRRLTLAVPMAALGAGAGDRYEWMVPGMLEEKIAVMLRGVAGGDARILCSAGVGEVGYGNF